jgi:hypothetical protein
MGQVPSSKNENIYFPECKAVSEVLNFEISFRITTSQRQIAFLIFTFLSPSAFLQSTAA